MFGHLGTGVCTRRGSMWEDWWIRPRWSRLHCEYRMPWSEEGASDWPVFGTDGCYRFPLGLVPLYFVACPRIGSWGARTPF